MQEMLDKKDTDHEADNIYYLECQIPVYAFITFETEDGYDFASNL